MKAMDVTTVRFKNEITGEYRIAGSGHFNQTAPAAQTLFSDAASRMDGDASASRL